ncbi:MAG: (deoxy)nucleoside triphosphate pyrophosphohydrolase [Myxococcota bacterium]
MSTVRVVAAVIIRDQKYLLTQRREEASLPLYWEFPGGKVEHGESDTQALQREVLERVGAEIEVGRPVAFQHHDYGDQSVELVLYEANIVGGVVEPRRVRTVDWVRATEFDRYPFPPADETARAKAFPLGELPTTRGKKKKGKPQA